MTPNFPFSAVLGQQRLKLALLLCAIDPAIGGVLVQGPRGVAKTTLARAFAELLPGRFVELPLGATEERLAGSLDLGKALGHAEVHFSPGLLARAHDGVLYVDEVNLLPDALVDLLLDAAATGINVVERDGVSHVHPARFVLVGTMNPDEGELRPQLCDRFGLSVSADPVLSPEQRTEVVLRRLAFEQDPAAFVARHAAEQEALIERCRSVRSRATAMPFAGAGLARAAELCHQAHVEGVRADLAMLRAARAHAAWHDRIEITAADVDAVAELALAHRRPPPGRPGAAGGPGEPARSGGAPRAGGSGLQPPQSSPPPRGHEAAHGETSAAEPTSPAHANEPGASPPNPAGLRSSARSGALPPVPVRSIDVGLLPSWLVTARPRTTSTFTCQRRLRGSGAIAAGSIDWIATLAELDRRSATLNRVKRRPRRLARPACWVIAVDCSASMLRSGGLARAKGIASELTRRAGRAKALVRLVTFGGAGVHVAMGGAHGQHRIDDAIASLGASGGTPLQDAIDCAHDLCAARSRQAPGPIQHRIFLLTDGRISQPLQQPADSPQNTVIWVVDLELGPVRLGRAGHIASSLAAGYVHADSLRAPT